MQAEKLSPAKELSTRCTVPDCLYVIVDNIAFATVDEQICSIVTPVTGNLRAKRNFTCEDITQSNLRTHLIHSNCSTLETQFVSVFKSKGTSYINFIVMEILTQMQRPHYKHILSMLQYQMLKGPRFPM